MNDLRSYILILAFLLFSTTQTIANTEKMTMAFANWKPVAFLTKEGHPKGVMLETVNEVFINRLKIDLQYRQRPWKRAQSDVKSGNADFIVTAPTDERAAYTVQGHVPFFKIDFALYTYADHPKIDTIQAIQSIQDIIDLDLTAITNLGNGWHKQHIENKGVKTIKAPSDENILDILIRKRADIMIDSKLSMGGMIKAKGYDHDIIDTGVLFEPTNFYILMGKQSKHQGLIDRIDEALSDAIADGTIERIYEKYGIRFNLN